VQVTCTCGSSAPDARRGKRQPPLGRERTFDHGGHASVLLPSFLSSFFPAWLFPNGPPPLPGASRRPQG
jgi:hypothetical protein